MKKVTKFQNEKVLVLGLAKSGVSAAKLLHDLGALVTVNDGKPFNENPQAQELLEAGITVITGSHPIELVDEGFSLMVKNPGIPYTHPMVARALELHIPVITEVELAYLISEAPIIGITGTNGKTTTTTMIATILNENRTKGQARLSGNIGYPASSVAQEATNDDELVMELSSFQLKGTQSFHPHIAVITNLYEAHIDYHQTRADYVASKWKIQANMTADDYLVLNWQQEEVRELAKTTQAQVVAFSTTEKVDGAYLLDGNLYYKDELVMPADQLGVPGSHNIENALAAIAVAKLMHVENSAIQTALSQFHGVKHRTQFIKEIAGVRYYNDSKATNILATQKALAGFDLSKVVLLVGGLDRGNSFDALIPSLKGLKAIILFGETKDKLADAAKQAGITSITMTENVETAVPIAPKLAQASDIVLLSPTNASWDQYPNFEVRGDKFIAAIEKI
ncbi:UDP-N-acetylmuramoyl-L-alanine--D-glutamate ligase [Enterococcus cecorum]